MMAEMMHMGDITMSHPSALGIKRAATDDLEREQRLTKKFTHLNLDQNRGARLNIPNVRSTRKNHIFQTSQCTDSRNYNQSDTKSDRDCMDVEETPTRIYITDLNAEIASLEPSSPSHPIFLPDIEKHLLGLPALVLGPSAEEEQLRRDKEKSMQMVVYGVPTSISIPEDRDNVRRAIEEARKRVRDRMPLGGQIEAAVKDLPTLWQRTHHRSNVEPIHLPTAGDPDAMEL